ncbi:ABC transporter, Membrane component (putative high-affinity D-ribose transport protein) [Modestobacter italicus]|uniref:ABC transporter, Membrane component (Putative high-affinity D-ribose transport protein) n=1 Tax=Modestobacter italicus (strain DSM 44449 / CECT 9708 / BC 501) TaxID=2732864 RepID=I4EU44_MODI5|nr:ABC transporter permease [Modestobacter marinus]CCH86907.1 ABC transporter, Membrane component (putative high-affinity D-ribose transport protein) [Modestobacter marinus]
MSTSTTTPADPTVQPPEKRGFPVAYWWDRVGIFLVLLLLIALMSAIAPNFLSVDNAVNVARSVSINAILAAGMTVVILTAGIDLSVGSILAVAGVGGVLLATNGVPTPLALLGGIAIGALCGAVNGALIAWLALPAFIVTLGSLTYLRGLAYSMLDGQPLVATDLGFRGIGNGSIAGIPQPVVVMLVVYVVFWFLLERTRFGRHVYAVGGNIEAARLAGINVKRVLLSTYMLSGAAAGVAGLIFSARVLSAQPTAGNGYELDAIAAVVLGGTSLAGGRGRIFGTLVGAVIIGVLSNGLVLLDVPFFYQLMIKGAVIIIAIALDSLKRFARSTS